jgi:hypothetical protein
VKVASVLACRNQGRRSPDKAAESLSAPVIGRCDLGNSTGNLPSHSWFSPRGALGEWLGHGSVQQRSYDRAGCD